MYATKQYQPKNSKDYLGIGDEYVKKKVPNPRYKNKQFQTQPPKKGQTAGYFVSDTFTYSSSEYQDTKKYLKIEPRNKRKKGFGSNDARRRDEFTLDVRARQWREKLKGEASYSQASLEAASEEAKTMSTDPAEVEDQRKMEYTQKYEEYPQLFQTRVPFDLYEIGRPEGSTPICNKCSRDTFYCKHRVGSGPITNRRPGDLSTSYNQIGSFDAYRIVQKPEYGKKEETKHFYDNSHLGTRT